jgi:broad specificity phosphatase PhoE
MARTLRLLAQTPAAYAYPCRGSLQELEARVADAFRLILHRQDSNIVVVVCHESGIRALLLQLLDLPASSYHTLAQDTCAISEICCAGDRPIIKTLNQTTHLMGV